MRRTVNGDGTWHAFLEKSTDTPCATSHHRGSIACESDDVVEGQTERVHEPDERDVDGLAHAFVQLEEAEHVDNHDAVVDAPRHDDQVLVRRNVRALVA